MKRTHRSIALLLLISTVAHADRLNDTGLRADQWASDSQYGTNDFSALNYIENHAPRQDSYYGRDPAEAAGALFKVGGGDQGFDFTRLCGNGNEEGTGTCPSGLTVDDLGTGEGQWACTRDNITGLTWELKTDDGGLQDVDWQYSWYNTDAASNGGNAGTQTPASNPSQCGSFLTNCNTEEYVAAVNALNDGAGLCGFTDWRMPHVPEMTNVAHLGETRRGPGAHEGEMLEQLDADYFPYIRGTIRELHFYWSATPVARNPALAWPFGFHSWKPFPTAKSTTFYAVLVRGEPTAAQASDCVNENPAIPAFTPTSDFTFNPDGTVTHHKTGLIWDQNAGCCRFWGDTLAYLKNSLNVSGYKGHHDWRLPNIKELTSIIEYRCWDPPFNTTVFPNMDADGIHSSTPIVASADGGGPAYTIKLDFYDGQREVEDGDALQSILLVRGGPLSSSFNAQYPKWFLRVDKAGGGSGTVTDLDGNCLELEENGGECLVEPGSDVTLQAVAGPGSTFTGWSASAGSVPSTCNDTTADCAIAAIAASGRVTANFLLLDPDIFADGFEPLP